jgi:two-component system phosphate regulon sensor histidine kinase PhoR
MKTEETKNALYNILDDVKNSEINLRRERDQSQAIISSMGEGLMVVDKEYKIILVNKKTEEILGINSEMMIKKDMREIISVYKKDQELIGDRPVMLMFQSLKTVNVKMEDEFYYNVLHNNRKFPVELIVSPLYDGENITAAIIVFQNITSRKALDEAKNSFISIASHQLRTPLTSIRWYTEMLSSEDAGPLTENQKNFLSRVYGSALKLNEVINLLLALARTESGKAAKEIVKIDPIVFTVDIIKELEPQFKPKNISVNFIPLKEPLEINYDISMLRQITSNLLSNSIHYTDKNGQIEIKIEKGKNELIYSIKDDGIGIPANQQDKIFNKFFRADNASAVVPDGSGLGLSLVKALVEMNNGKVWFESPASWVDKNGKEEKRGTVFYFTLPL